MIILGVEKFEELAQKENQKKIQKCVKNLQEFIEKKQINVRNLYVFTCVNSLAATPRTEGEVV